ncbi:MAG: peptidyl-prolyl cis-trans isomerase [Rhodospirillaceae bacterium]|nr:peptidyl-prolyl cis-trans isomerase [Rhodospirillaceae bacterium]
MSQSRDPISAQNRRTLALGAVGALAGLAMAGYALFTAEGTSTLYVAPENVAVVNQQPISRIDYAAALQTLYAKTLGEATTEERQRVLDDLIAEELMVQRAKELDVPLTDQMVRSSMVSAVQAQAAMSAYTELPGEAELKAYFETNVAEYQSEGIMAVKNYVFADASTAAAAVTALKAGLPAAAVLKTYGGTDTERVKGEEFYFAAKIHLGDVLFAAARELPDGGISAPVQDNGHHVLVMIKNVRPVAYSFDSARAKVLQDYRRDTAKKLQAANRDFLHKRANILIAEDMRK